MPHSQTILRAKLVICLMSPAAPLETSPNRFLRRRGRPCHSEQVESLFRCGGSTCLPPAATSSSRATAARDDRDLVQRLGVLEQARSTMRVPGFVIGGGSSPCRSSPGCGAPSPADFVARFFEFGQCDRFQPAPRGEQRGFVDDIRQLRAGITGRAARDHSEIDASSQLHFLGVDPQDFFAAFDVGQIDGDLAVETARAQQAGSSTSGRLVAAMMMTPSCVSKPSISTSSALSVCSRSSWPPPRPWPRCRPTASISSMKMRQARSFCLARTCRARGWRRRRRTSPQNPNR